MADPNVLPSVAFAAFERTADSLRFDAVVLALADTMAGDVARGLMPSFHFRITFASLDVGHLNLRVGTSPHVEFVAGHLGYAIDERHRGHGYAYQACRAIEPLVRVVNDGSAILTCDPDNHASRRTIERLGATFLGEHPVPPHDPAYARGSRVKFRYRWTPVLRSSP